MDKVFIEGLEIEALIGIYDWERRIRQPLRLDVEMDFDNRRPAASDDIADTLDYKAVSKRLIAFVSQSEFGLVESLAERCAELVLREFGVARVRLKLAKPGAVRGAACVGVVIERQLTDLLAKPAPAVTGPATAPRKSVPTAAASDAAGDTPSHVGTVPGSAAAGSPPAAPEPARPERSVEAWSRTREAAATTPSPAPAPQTTATTMPRGGSLPGARVRTFITMGSNIDAEHNLRQAVAALRARFGEVTISPVYRTKAVGFDGPDFLNAIAAFDCGIHPFALNHWLHSQEIAQGRDRRDTSYIDRTLDMDIIYFGSLVLDGPGDFQLPRVELHHAFVLKPLVDIAPDFIDPIRHLPLSKVWAGHPQHDDPPARADLVL